MTFTKITAAALGATLVGVSTLALAVPAGAATSLGDTTFYGSSDFGAEGATYPAGFDWFFGSVVGSGSAEFTSEGLLVNDSLAGKVQILNQNFGTTFTSAAEVTEFLEYTEVIASSPDWTFQLPLFADGATGFTTLRPNAPGVITDATEWITSQAIAGSPYGAEASAPLADLLAAVYAGAAPDFLAYGLFWMPTQVTTVVGIETPVLSSVFIPQPVRTVSPNPISAVDLATPGKGLTLTGSGWLPNSPVYLAIGTEDGPVFLDTTTYTADASGNVSATIVTDEVLPVGTYGLFFDDDAALYGLGALPQLQLEVVEATAAAPVLAATGSESAGVIAAAGGFLLIGGLVTLVAIRRKTAQSL